MIKRSLLLSRPRFWPYLIGPYVIGQVAAGTPINWWWAIVLGLFFTYPANYIIYGVNDAYDYETDRLNPKKQAYEQLLRPQYQHEALAQSLFWGIIGLALVLLAPGQTLSGVTGYFGFILFGVFYSAPPIRAKARPLIDSMFNVLYVFPAVVSYELTTGNLPRPTLFFAAMLWCMAMHAFSAVPDIAADKKAHLRTIATWLGAQGTLVFCLACYGLAGLLSLAWLGWFGLVATSIYVLLMALALFYKDSTRVFALYKWFPYLNILVGAGLFFYVALVATKS